MTLELPVLAQPPAHSTSRLLRSRGIFWAWPRLGLQRLLGFTQDLAAIIARPQALGELVAARLTEQLVLAASTRAASSRIYRAICS